MTEPLHRLDCAETARGVREGRFSARERVEAALTHLHAVEPAVGAFLEVTAEQAIEQARRVDAHPDRPSLRLAGVPLAIKDNLCVRGARTTAGSRILARYRSPYTATAVERLVDAGAVVVGKANLDEFSMGSSTENSALGRTVNPWDPAHVPGGSSGGSAAAVATGMAAGALGSDTGGSIRQPAAFCGVVGMKPTYGRVSRYGLIAFASSLDQVGPLARTARDAALLLGCIAGHDPLDSTSLREPVPDFVASLGGGARGLRIGVLQDHEEGVDGAVRDSLAGTLAALSEAGAEVVPVELPHQQYAIATYYVIATAEASSNLARYDGVRYGSRAKGSDTLEELYARTRSEGFGAEVKRRILLGTYVLSAGYYDAYYGRAQRVRTLLRRDYESAFAQVDVLLGPTTPSTAFAFGDKTDDPLAMYLSDVFTVTANLAGIPAVSVPSGLDDNGLPIGLQVAGPPLHEARILQVAHLIESLRGPMPEPRLATPG